MGKRMKDRLEMQNEINALKGAINSYRKACENFNDDPTGTRFTFKNLQYDIMCALVFEPSHDEPNRPQNYHEGQE
jgi:hypothetical protein